MDSNIESEVLLNVWDVTSSSQSLLTPQARRGGPAWNTSNIGKVLK